MHGRPRVTLKPEDEAALAAKAAKLRDLQSQFLANHHNKNYEKEALDLSAKLLETNPEFYTAWNYRKLAVEYHLSRLEESDPDSVQSILNEELRVAEGALRQNYKSYGAWHHRKWVLSKGHTSVDHELLLLDKFQKADSRNFHAWNYRRFIAALKNVPEVGELQYTTDMIERNFSNYSAWHHRSTLLSNLLNRRAEGFFPKDRILNDEYELVHQAIFTDPDDQSGWFYHLWLLEQTVKLDAPVLMSSWPANGAKLGISVSEESDSHMVLQLGSHHFETQVLPLVLYFDQPVTGLNSSTVSVNSLLSGNKDLIWKPLSRNRDESCRAWLAELCCNQININSPEAYPVKITLGESLGIKSLNGADLSGNFQCEFIVRVEHHDLQCIRGQDIVMISWEDSNFHKYDAVLEKSSLSLSSGLLGICNEMKSGAFEWKVDIIKNEVELFRELLSEADCKIGKLTLGRLLTAVDVVTSSIDPMSSSDQMVHHEEVLDIFSDLMKSDPEHLEYYKDERSSALLRQITSSSKTFSRYSWSYSPCAPSDDMRFVGLRLNNLQLTRIGSIHQLLWVQMLDISRNELRTTEGLEALQLLSYLNLSGNKLKSFTALDSLCQLKALRVLDISHNEIGAHSIDSTRYLCASPLSHSTRSGWKHEVFSTVVEIVNYWEAFSIFKDLNLVQLNIAGNWGVDDKDFKLFLLRILPSLKWLDGVSVH